MSRVEQVVTREQLAAALDTVFELLPQAPAGEDDDGDLELHLALRRRDVYAVGADKWGDPRARLACPADHVSQMMATGIQ